MNAAEVRDAVLRSLSSRLKKAGLSEDEIDGDASLIALGVIDSFSFVELLMDLQRDLSVEVDFMELSPDDFSSINGLVRVLSEAS
jgi:acyl carrier protein